MATSVVMPALEMAQETGKLVSWKKKEGDQVKKGEILLEVETDKAVVEIEAAVDGVLAGVTAKVDDVVPVGQVIAWLLKAGESVPASSGAPQQTGRKMDSAPAAAVAAPVAEAAPEPASVAGAKISPKARRLAREHGVDIARVKGSGPGGEILADDIMKSASSASAAVAAPPAATARPASPPATAQPGSDTGAVSSIGKIIGRPSWARDVPCASPVGHAPCNDPVAICTTGLVRGPTRIVVG